MAAVAEPESEVQKVYISDSPTLDDQVEYNYVNSDFEEDISDEKTDHQEESIGDEDELAKEAKYQQELQQRLSKTALNDKTLVSFNNYFSVSWWM